jgi:multicomponent Na+:H+ antiporter subunit E
MTSAVRRPGSRARAALLRAAGFFGFWLLLARPVAFDWADLAVGLLAAALATWASLQLLPPGPLRLRYGALARLVARFLWQSLVAGLDVARRVFDPRLPIKPGYLVYAVRIPDGPRRAAFGAFTSLMPGTLPVGTDPDGALVYHCLDLDQAVASSLARDEALVAAAQGGETARD